MFGIITPLARNTLHTHCRFATSSALRSRMRHSTSPPRSGQKAADQTWNLVDEIKTKNPYKDVPKTPAQKWGQISQMAFTYLRERPPATTYSGRSVQVKGGNVAEAYGRLQSILQRNKVQAQLRLTERHEKKGVKRRRLSSERWRRQFAHEVHKKVQLVTKIRNRGA